LDLALERLAVRLKKTPLGYLLGQNQLVLTGDPQPVHMTRVFDQDLLLTEKKIPAVIPFLLGFVLQ
jgi:hypothetical protein